MKYLVSVLALLLGSQCFAQGEPAKVRLPLEVKHEMKVLFDDPSIEGKVWNRWTTKNFVVCSLNDKQAQYLHKHLELVKAWAFSRWGLYDIDFSAECRLICVDDKALFKKLFNLENSKVEIRRDKDGKIEMAVIFLLLDGDPSRTVPIPLTEVCLAEFEQKYRPGLAGGSTVGCLA